MRKSRTRSRSGPSRNLKLSILLSLLSDLMVRKRTVSFVYGIQGIQTLFLINDNNNNDNNKSTFVDLVYKL